MKPSEEACSFDGGKIYCPSLASCISGPDCESCPHFKTLDETRNRCIRVGNGTCADWNNRVFCSFEGRCHPASDCGMCFNNSSVDLSTKINNVDWAVDDLLSLGGGSNDKNESFLHPIVWDIKEDVELSESLFVLRACSKGQAFAHGLCSQVFPRREFMVGMKGNTGMSSTIEELIPGTILTISFYAAKRIENCNLCPTFGVELQLLVDGHAATLHRTNTPLHDPAESKESEFLEYSTSLRVPESGKIRLTLRPMPWSPKKRTL